MTAKLVTKGVIPYTPSIDVARGTIVKIGFLIGVVNREIKADELGSILTGQILCIPRKTGAVFTQGDRAYIDLVTQEVTDDSNDDFLGIYLSDDELSSNFVNIKLNEYFGSTTGGGGGTVSASSVNFGDGIASVFILPHGRSTDDLSATIKEISSGEIITSGVSTVIDSTNVTLTFTGLPVPTLNQFRLTIIGDT